MQNSFSRTRARFVVLIICFVMAGPAMAASQAACWSPQDFKKDDPVTFVSTNNNLKLEATLSADAVFTKDNPAGSAKLTQPVSVMMHGSPDAYLSRDNIAFEFSDIPVTLANGTVIEGKSLLKGQKINVSIAQTPGNPLTATLDANEKFTPSSQYEPDTLQPAWLPSAGALPTLKLLAEKPGAFDDAQTAENVSVCLFVSGSWRKVNVTGFERETNSDSALVTVALPGDFGRYPARHGIAVLINNGTFIGAGRFFFIPRWIGFLAAVGLFVVGHLLVWRLAMSSGSNFRQLFTGGSLGKFSAAWFSGANNVPSLAMFQIYLWTWVVICGLTYVVVQTLELFSLSSQVLWILGIAGIGSLSARFIAGPASSTQSALEPRFSDILRTDDKLDLYKLQMFIFTCFTAAWVTVRILADQTFPTLDDNLLLLMGISNGLYVGSKVVAETPVEAVARLTRELEKAKAEEDLQAKKVDQFQTDLDALTNNPASAAADIQKKQAELNTANTVLTATQNKATSVADQLVQAQAKLPQ